MALADIPGYGAYVQRRQMNEQAPLAELQQVGALQALLEGRRKQAEAIKATALEEKYRTELAGLGPDATPDALSKVASKYAAPKDLMTVQTAHADRQASLVAKASEAQARLTQSQQNADMIHEFKMSRAVNDVDRAAETARHNKAIEGIQTQNNTVMQELRRLGLQAKSDAASLGKVLPAPLQKQLTEAGELADATQRFVSTFKPEYGGKTFSGGLSNTVGRIFGDDTGQSQWWQDYELHQSQIRNKLFGSALTAPEIKAWELSAINPRMESKQIKLNLERRNALEKTGIERLMRGAAAGRYNKEQIEAFTGRSLSGGPAAPAPAAPAQFSEGQTATGPGGQKIIFKGGQWQPVSP